VGTRGSGEKREYGGKGAPISLPLVLDPTADDAGAATVPLHSAFSSFELLYGPVGDNVSTTTI
jgi:hypothetical protein